MKSDQVIVSFVGFHVCMYYSCSCLMQFLLLITTSCLSCIFSPPFSLCRLIALGECYLFVVGATKNKFYLILSYFILSYLILYIYLAYAIYTYISTMKTTCILCFFNVSYLNASQYDNTSFSFTLFSCLKYCFIFYIVLQYSHSI